MILQTKELTKFYRGKKAIERININVPKNSIYALIGLNGAGKSTLINIICGFLSQSSGSILFKEKDISSDKKEFFNHSGISPQEGEIYSNLTIHDFLYDAARFKKVKKEELHNEIKNICTTLQLDESLDKKIGNLSFGKKKLTSVAQAFLGKPSLVILDEPFEGLDSRHKEVLSRFIIDFSSQRTILMASHLIEELDDLITHLGIIHQGNLIFEGDLKKISNPNCFISVILDKNNEGLIKKIKKIKGVISVCSEDKKINATTNKDISSILINLLEKEGVSYKRIYKGKTINQIFNEYSN